MAVDRSSINPLGISTRYRHFNFGRTDYLFRSSASIRNLGVTAGNQSTWENHTNDDP